MNDEPPYDRDREPDDDYARQLFVLVVCGTAAVILVLIVATFLNGCVEAEHPPATLPTIPLTLPAPPDHITVPTTTTVAGDTQR